MVKCAIACEQMGLALPGRCAWMKSGFMSSPGLGGGRPASRRPRAESGSLRPLDEAIEGRIWTQDREVAFARAVGRPRRCSLRPLRAGENIELASSSRPRSIGVGSGFDTRRRYLRCGGIGRCAALTHGLLDARRDRCRFTADCRLIGFGHADVQDAAANARARACRRGIGLVDLGARACSRSNCRERSAKCCDMVWLRRVRWHCGPMRLIHHSR